MCVKFIKCSLKINHIHLMPWSEQPFKLFLNNLNMFLEFLEFAYDEEKKELFLRSFCNIFTLLYFKEGFTFIYEWKYSMNILKFHVKSSHSKKCNLYSLMSKFYSFLFLRACFRANSTWHREILQGNQFSLYVWIFNLIKNISFSVTNPLIIDGRKLILMEKLFACI